MAGTTPAPLNRFVRRSKSPEPPNEDSPSESDRQRTQWHAEFDAAARRLLELRMRYAFIKTYKPVMDDASFRAFDTMADYRRWCEENLPSWLGYRRD